ncbi:sugar ABC transporter substrate-binding protein, partial [bacterium]|nr:sugar ABC transporter substrate-binding protein [bacterium]
YEDSHPGLKVRWLDLPQAAMLPKLMASIAGGVPPDVVNLTTGTALTLARSGALTDIGSCVTAEQSAVYWPKLWQAASYRQGIYAVPWYLSTRVLIYNRSLFRQAGIADAAPRTWDDVAWAARIVRQRTPAYGYEPVIRLIDDWRMAGVRIYDPASGRAAFNTELARRRLEWYASLRRDGLIPEDTLIEGYQGAVDRYKQGTLAMLEAGPQLLLSIEADAPQVYAQTDVGYLPTGASGELPAALMNLVVPCSSPRRAEALELALFITSKDKQLELVREVPLLPSAIVSERELFGGRQLPGLQNKALRCSFAQLPKANDFSLGLPDAPQLEKALKEAVEMTFYGQGSAEEALKMAEGYWNSIIEAR